MAHQRALNALDTRDGELLLVEVGSGSAIHLAREAQQHGRSAIPEHWDSASLTSAERAELMNARWAPRTLCGRDWSAMAAGELGPLHQWQEVELAPSCRRCLNILDGTFPSRPPDGRVSSLALGVVHALRTEGVAAVVGVPGDQAEALRKEIRRAVRKELGFSTRTLLHEDTVHVLCDEAFEPHRERRMRLVADVLGGDPTAPPEKSAWELQWRDWADLA